MDASPPSSIRALHVAVWPWWAARCRDVEPVCKRQGAVLRHKVSSEAKATARAYTVLARVDIRSPVDQETDAFRLPFLRGGVQQTHARTRSRTKHRAAQQQWLRSFSRTHAAKWMPMSPLFALVLISAPTVSSQDATGTEPPEHATWNGVYRPATRPARSDSRLRSLPSKARDKRRGPEQSRGWLRTVVASVDVGSANKPSRWTRWVMLRQTTSRRRRYQLCRTALRAWARTYPCSVGS